MSSQNSHIASPLISRDIRFPQLNTSEPLKIAVLISGTGSNMVAIQRAICAGKLDASIELVVSSNVKAAGIQKARELGLDVLVFSKEDYACLDKVEQKMVDNFKARGVEYVVMAGYMRKVGRVLLNAFENAVINLHPALLPKFPGAHGIQDAFDAGERETGITIHLANKEYDEGPILYQRTVPILEDDTVETLEERIHAAEHEAYPFVLQQISCGML